MPFSTPFYVSRPLITPNLISSRTPIYRYSTVTFQSTPSPLHSLRNANNILMFTLTTKSLLGLYTTLQFSHKFTISQMLRTLELPAITLFLSNAHYNVTPPIISDSIVYPPLPRLSATAASPQVHFLSWLHTISCA